MWRLRQAYRKLVLLLGLELDTRLIATEPMEAEQWRAWVRRITPRSLYDAPEGMGAGPGWWKCRRDSPGRSLAEAARLFEATRSKVICEIGSGLQGGGSGNSALVWLHQTSAIEIYCVDPDPAQIDSVQVATPDSQRQRIHCVEATGQEFLRSFGGKLDLLYLDFWQESAELRSSAYLDVYRLAAPLLNPAALILIDDTDHADPWKQTQIVPAACSDGFRVIWGGRQTMLRRQI